MKQFSIRLILVLVMAYGTVAQADAVPAATGEPIAKLALEWFGRMKTGDIDRSRLSAEYNAQLTAEAVHALSQYLNSRDYGTAPEKAEVMEQRAGDRQTVYLLRLTFPRGDTGSMLLGMSTNDKITGIMILGLPGD
ncbi:hypothetical protein V5F38_10970 [Xanthobacter sp. V0B-10]|uniref:hypothetical protein n=1 Tax=Xanthobacter albus TaxID=3119929 RepID=UPI003726F399